MVRGDKNATKFYEIDLSLRIIAKMKTIECNGDVVMTVDPYQG